MMTTYAHDKTAKQFKFELNIKAIDADQYVAMGLSKDDKMGEDLVFFCVAKTGKPLGAKWNSGKSPGDDVKIADINIVETEETKEIDGSARVSSHYQKNLLINTKETKRGLLT